MFIGFLKSVSNLRYSIALAELMESENNDNSLM